MSTDGSVWTSQKVGTELQ